MCKYVILPLSYVCAEANVGSALDFWEGKNHSGMILRQFGGSFKVPELDQESHLLKLKKLEWPGWKVGQWSTLPNELFSLNACGLPSSLHGVCSLNSIIIIALMFRNVCFIPSDGLKDDKFSHLLMNFLPLLFTLPFFQIFYCTAIILCSPPRLLLFSLSSPHPDMSGPHGSVGTAGLHRHHRQCGGHEVH